MVKKMIIFNKFSMTGINHNVDELLVGVLTQIRLKRRKVLKRKNSATKVSEGYNKNEMQ